MSIIACSLTNRSVLRRQRFKAATVRISKQPPMDVVRTSRGRANNESHRRQACEDNNQPPIPAGSAPQISSTRGFMYSRNSTICLGRAHLTSPFFLMNRTVGAYGLAMERTLRGVGMDIPRWRVLLLAHKRRPVSVGEIADNAVLKPSTTAKFAKRLRNEGLVSLSRRKHDRRVTDVKATASGERAALVARRVASTLYRNAFDGIEAGAVAELNKTLVEIHLNLGATH